VSCRTPGAGSDDKLLATSLHVMVVRDMTQHVQMCTTLHLLPMSHMPLSDTVYHLMLMGLREEVHESKVSH